MVEFMSCFKMVACDKCNISYRFSTPKPFSFNKRKNHHVFHLPNQVKRMGSLVNTSAERWEAYHKVVVKRLYPLTQRHEGTFEKQMARLIKLRSSISRALAHKNGHFRTFPLLVKTRREFAPLVAGKAYAVPSCKGILSLPARLPSGGFFSGFSDEARREVRSAHLVCCFCLSVYKCALTCEYSLNELAEVFHLQTA